MLTRSHRLAVVSFGLGAGLALMAGEASAHANLVSSDPAKNATIASPAAITLHFSEALEPKVSGFKLTNIDGKPVTLKTMAAPDAKSLAAAPSVPLTPGLYTITWTSMGDDATRCRVPSPSP